MQQGLLCDLVTWSQPAISEKNDGLVSDSSKTFYDGSFGRWEICIRFDIKNIELLSVIKRTDERPIYEAGRWRMGGGSIWSDTQTPPPNKKKIEGVGCFDNNFKKNGGGGHWLIKVNLKILGEGWGITVCYCWISSHWYDYFLGFLSARYLGNFFFNPSWGVGIWVSVPSILLDPVSILMPSPLDAFSRPKIIGKKKYGQLSKFAWPWASKLKLIHFHLFLSIFLWNRRFHLWANHLENLICSMPVF
jgi:hypothetical protein